MRAPIRAASAVLVLSVFWGCANGGTVSPSPTKTPLMKTPMIPWTAPSATGSLARWASPTIQATASLPPLHRVFTPTGGIANVAHMSTATRLLDGRVLMIGMGPYAPDLTWTDFVDTYDPASGNWTEATAGLAAGWFTLTTLVNGRVLVIYGGMNDDGADLYDPATGHFTPTGPMVEDQYLSTATLLQDGRVLIVGGTPSDGGESNLTAAEIYDPATNQFTSTGSMHTGRVNAGAVRLTDGRVLIMGGDQVRCASGLCPAAPSTEIYDPATGEFSPAGSLPLSDFGRAALLSDGRVLVADDAAVYAHSASDDLAIFDPATRAWSSLGSVAIDVEAAVPLASGSVLMVARSGDAALYDPSSRTLTTIPGIDNPGWEWIVDTNQRQLVAVPLLDGRILLPGTRSYLYWP